MLQQAMAALRPPQPQPASPQPWDLAWLAGPDAQWTVDATMPS
eukprot:CAMPEP_0175852382 /NCGR_PEP_ID=MMETSP0107_2-20121207/26174_1 /TAXON_ID=195067 ORGANISM="Goniomonas pacifica, Strain CCMP1869" /NCGR_SAMPLE_ID=MMETSP0107_2 /ASSEMBLY_ACC=CAM_ASM_000203 /LENGTH=42 /DNA_ID= /DNA_START= /DNA_END= /DNA_ORIENTATION=